MDNFVTRSSQRFSQASQATSSKGKEPLFMPHHSAGSHQLARAQAAAITLSSSDDGSPLSSPCPSFLHELPADDRSRAGVEFEINWEDIWLGTKRLASSRVGYRVKHKGRLLGGREASFIWKYGAELVYQDDDGKLIKLWLCKVCHLQRLRTATKKCSAYHHISDHLRRTGRSL